MTPKNDADARYAWCYWWYASGDHHGVTDTREEAERMMEKYTERYIESFVTRKSPDGSTTYYYRSEAEADANRDGAHARHITRVEGGGGMNAQRQARCQCGAIAGMGCGTSESVKDMVMVEYMPEDRRGSHIAAGNRGVYPTNGAMRLIVTYACAEAAVEADPDWTRVVEEGEK